MTSLASQAASLTPADLAELLGAVNEATGRLQASHERLHGEVARLQAELSEANSQLERSRRLAALGEMAAGIAHEVRNPLGSIGLYARMLDQDLADRPEQQAVARKIARAVHSLDSVVRDVLMFARDLHPRLEEADARDILSEAIELASPGVAVRDVRILRPDLDGGVPARLACDTVLVRQALVNIVRNALEAMVEHAAPPVLHAQARTEGAAVIIEVRDSGPGVPTEALERIFNPFFTTRETGTGLGLAIVHRIIDAHGGAISIRNLEPQRGAAVEIRLPVAPHPHSHRHCGGSPAPAVRHAVEPGLLAERAA